jgi:hypothetical protein
MADRGARAAGRAREADWRANGSRNNKRDGKVYLKPVQTVAASVPFGRPYNAPFAMREGDLN